MFGHLNKKLRDESALQVQRQNKISTATLLRISGNTFFCRNFHTAVYTYRYEDVCHGKQQVSNPDYEVKSGGGVGTLAQYSVKAASGFAKIITREIGLKSGISRLGNSSVSQKK
jgi:hypothetical protein